MPPSMEDPGLILALRRQGIHDERVLAAMSLLNRADFVPPRLREVASADEALQTFAEWKPDILVSDIGMPGEDGYSLIRKVRALPLEHGGNVPAAALTGYVSQEDYSKALSAGYHSQIKKPVELEELIAVVASLGGRTKQV